MLILLKTKAQGVKVLKSIKPGEQFVKILRDELVVLLGTKSTDLNLKNNPSVILLAGLQGAGKTTTAIKLANRFKKKRKKCTCSCSRHITDLERLINWIF